MKAFLKDKKTIEELDKSAVQLIIFLGFVWLAFWFIGALAFYFGLEDETIKAEYYERFTGKYAFALWIQPMFWFLLTQAYRIRFIRKHLIPRIIISLLFVVTIERFTLIVTTLHRDYLPSSWASNNEFGMDMKYPIVGLLGKILVFLAVVCLYHFGVKKIKNALYQRH
ncbi:MAG: hypothetical protein H6607_02720 [Flavobacteriales bacterium]|nr:hypothetical protein [Flavobacteriales bacterium]